MKFRLDILSSLGIKFRSFLDVLISLPLLLFRTNFVVQKKCNLYDPNNLPKEGNEGEIIGDIEPEDNKKYKFKRTKTVGKKIYAILERDKVEYAVDSGCGYTKTKPQPESLNSAFKDKEKKILYSDEFKETMDYAVINWCGHFGGNPSRESFEKILRDEKFVKEYNEIHKNLKGTIKTINPSKDIFIRELLDVLFNRDGLLHMVCGEPEERTVGGLHYYYRVLELDSKYFTGISNKQCITSKSNKHIINYSIEFVNVVDNISTKCNAGFVKEHNIVDLISIGAMAAKATNEIESLNIGNSNKVCLYKYKGVYYKLVRNTENVLVTAYPISEDTCFTENAADTSICECQFND